MTLEDETTAALTGVESVVRRFKSLADLRAKQDRHLSDANQERISHLIESLTAMQDAAKSAPEDDPTATKALAEEYLKYQLTTARLLGVR